MFHRYGKAKNLIHIRGNFCMKSIFRFMAAMLTLLAFVLPVRAEDLLAAMEAENVKWLTAYNTNTPATFKNLYTKDAILMPSGLKPVTGALEIAQFWETRLKPGNKKDHTFEVISVGQEGKLAYQVNRWSVIFIKDGGEKALLVGNSTRVFEHQDDGSWRIKVHIYTLDQ